MDIFNQLTKYKNSEMFLSILFIIFLVANIQTPTIINNLIQTNIGKIIIIILALSLFAYTNPLLAILGLLVTYKIIHNNNGFNQETINSLYQYNPTEEKVWSPFNSQNQFSYTLEQEIVNNMTTNNFNQDYVKMPYKPVLDNTYGASSVF